MLPSEKNSFASLLKAVFSIYEREIGRDLMAMWWAALERFEFDDVRKAFDRHVQGKEGKLSPKPAHIIEHLNTMHPDGRPSPDEAWAMIPRSEDESVVITEEMAEALRYAQPLLDVRDQVAARRAFIDAYSRIVEKNKLDGIKPKWFPSFGMNPEGRSAAIAEAVRIGRLGVNHAIKLSAPDQAARMLEMAGKPELALEFKPGTSEAAKEGLARIRAMFGMDENNVVEFKKSGAA